VGMQRIVVATLLLVCALMSNASPQQRLAKTLAAQRIQAIDDASVAATGVHNSAIAALNKANIETLTDDDAIRADTLCKAAGLDDMTPAQGSQLASSCLLALGKSQSVSRVQFVNSELRTTQFNTLVVDVVVVGGNYVYSIDAAMTSTLASTTSIGSQTHYYPTSANVPIGAVFDCAYVTETSILDLTNTNFAVDPSVTQWYAFGWDASGGASWSQNNQYITISATGDCGIASPLNNNELGSFAGDYSIGIIRIA